MTPTARTAPQPVKSACNAMLDIRLPSHDEAIALVFACRSVVGQTGSLSSSCQKAVMDQLSEVVSWIVDDQFSQQEEQSWNEEQTRAAPFTLTPAMRSDAAAIAGVLKQPLEQTA